MFLNIKYNIIVGLLFFIPKISYSYDLISALYSEPVGVRYDNINGEIKQSEDGFYGVNPQFIYSKSNPSKLMVLWPDSKTLGKDAKQWTHEAIIVDANDSVISSIAIYNQRVDVVYLVS